MKPKALIVILFCGALVFLLSQIFSGQWILPQYLRFGPLTIHFYGLTMAAAVLAGIWLARSRAAVYGISNEISENFFIWLTVAGFVGARLYHVLSSIGYYSLHPLDALKPWEGGLGIYGALLGGLLVLGVYSKCHSLNAKRLLDWLAPSIVLGQIIGRLGNLFNYEAYGYPTSLPWKMFVPREFRPEIFSEYAFFHPLFLYEMAVNSLILGLLLKLSKRKQPAGLLFFIYLLLYNVGRFFIELLRTDSTFVGIFRLNSLVSFSLLAIALAGIYLVRAGHEENP